MKKLFGKKLLISMIVASIIAGGFGAGVYASNQYFSSHIDILKDQYNQEIEDYMEDPKFVNGAMHRYLNHELHPKLDEEANMYYQEALAKWEKNQNELSPEEQEKLDKAYDQALQEVKNHIDSLFEEYGGY